MKDFNELLNLKNKIVEKKKEEGGIVEEKVSPFAKKSPFGWLGSLWKVNMKSWIKINLKRNQVVEYVLWILLISLSFYAYDSGLQKKNESIPTLKKELSILENNILKQAEELSALDKINLDSSTLEIKEELLDKYLPTENELLYIEQANTLYQVAKEVWLNIDSLQKIEVKRDDNKIIELWNELANKWIDNFYEDNWYTKFIISTISSEEIIVRFKEKVEDRVEFVFDWFSINEADWELKYSFSLKAFYNLKQ